MNDFLSRPRVIFGAKAFLAFAVLFPAVNLVDFLFYGKRATDLLMAIGLALIACGTYTNGLRSRSTTRKDDLPSDEGGSTRPASAPLSPLRHF